MRAGVAQHPHSDAARTPRRRDRPRARWSSAAASPGCGPRSGSPTSALQRLPRRARARARRLAGHVRRRCSRTTAAGRDQIDAPAGRDRGAARHHGADRAPSWSAKTGSFGNYTPGHASAVNSDPPDTIAVTVGTLVIATGFRLLRAARSASSATASRACSRCPSSPRWSTRPRGPLTYQGRRVRSVAYVYCVGNRQPGGNEYCSKFCCAATVHASLKVVRARPVDPAVPPAPRRADVRHVRADVHRVARARFGVPAVPGRHPADRRPRCRTARST